MRTTSLFATLTVGLAALLAAAPAHAQYGVQSQDKRAIGERYHVELGGDLWKPTPLVDISSESLGIAGTDIDLIRDLGVEKRTFRQLHVVLRPAKKHKFRLDYTPISYTTEATLQRTIVFNGIAYQVGIPVSLDFSWKALHIGYEYDFVYRERGFAGFILQAKYTDVQVNLKSLVNNEFAQAKAPIPAIGGIGRAYLVSNVAVTFEISGISLPSSIKQGWEAKYVEYDLYGTINVANAGGVRIGYRSIDVNYTFDLDHGDFRLKGPYIGGVVRF